MSRLMFFIVYPIFMLGYLFGWALQAFLVGMLGAREHIADLLKEGSK